MIGLEPASGLEQRLLRELLLVEEVAGLGGPAPEIGTRGFGVVGDLVAHVVERRVASLVLAVRLDVPGMRVVLHAVARGRSLRDRSGQLRAIAAGGVREGLRNELD